ncbi:MAG: hypothetical protein ETSY2_44100 [Candidatus Entotheonella gemina]|uniref:Uncharacterized protein n=1 Tax=Candidatus Entotheonella gemina TaxID=1429439 RepID=W4LIA7_9BACT|nr:MAG: hypothetical protein ETSY2_44100 [Candidatus Entotheonella gemina]
MNYHEILINTDTASFIYIKVGYITFILTECHIGQLPCCKHMRPLFGTNAESMQ